jgi:hypothetical protein
VLLTGSIQIAGQSQSPRGSLALTSTRPNRIDTEPWVERRAEKTGGMTWPLLCELSNLHAVSLPGSEQGLSV